LPKYLSGELERIQKRAIQIIFPNINYQDVLKYVTYALRTNDEDT
jgi:hypothetical protein